MSAIAKAQKFIWAESLPEFDTKLSKALSEGWFAYATTLGSDEHGYWTLVYMPIAKPLGEEHVSSFRRRPRRNGGWQSQG